MMRSGSVVAQIMPVAVEGSGMSVVGREGAVPRVGIDTVSMPRRVAVSFMVPTQHTEGSHEYKSDKSKSKEYCVGFHRSTLRRRRSSI
jgi:hypothetical protein